MRTYNYYHIRQRNQSYIRLLNDDDNFDSIIENHKLNKKICVIENITQELNNTEFNIFNLIIYDLLNYCIPTTDYVLKIKYRSKKLLDVINKLTDLKIDTCISNKIIGKVQQDNKYIKIYFSPKMIYACLDSRRYLHNDIARYKEYYAK